MSKRALILGIGGQDGSFLADLLLARGDAVAGLYRHSSYDNLARIAHCRDRVQLFRGDVIDVGSLERALVDFRPDEVYHVADQDNVGWSRASPYYQRLMGDSVGALLDRARVLHSSCRVFVPLSVTMFGNAPPPQAETAGIDPKSPYAQAKAHAWRSCRYYHGLGVYVSCGIMFNHDSPRRKPGYLLQDLCRGALEVKAGRREFIGVGSLTQQVDVGHARDAMRAAVALLARPEPLDVCVGTGQAWTIQALAFAALRRAGVGGSLTDKVRPDPARATAARAPDYQADTTRMEWAGLPVPAGPAPLIDEIITALETGTATFPLGVRP